MKIAGQLLAILFCVVFFYWIFASRSRGSHVCILKQLPHPSFLRARHRKLFVITEILKVCWIELKKKKKIYCVVFFNEKRVLRDRIFFQMKVVITSILYSLVLMKKNHTIFFFQIF